MHRQVFESTTVRCIDRIAEELGALRATVQAQGEFMADLSARLDGLQQTVQSHDDQTHG